MNRLNSIQDLEALQQTAVARRQQLKKWIRVCSGTACHSQGGQELVRTFQQYLEGANLTHGVPPKGWKRTPGGLLTRDEEQA